MEILKLRNETPDGSSSSKFNGHRLKPFLEPFPTSDVGGGPSRGPCLPLIDHRSRKWVTVMDLTIHDGKATRSGNAKKTKQPHNVVLVTGKDLLGIMLHDNSKNKKLSVEELVDECKTLFFSGHETTALALTWTLFLLALHPEWQNHLREEIKQVIGEGELLLNDLTNIRKLKKMGWVMNEVLRLYSAAPNVQRQAREDIQVGELIIPSGTNIWVDLVGMNHDSDLWGNDVNEFKPERFKDDTLHGGCKHKMGYLPFGFGGRMCIGRNLTIMEYKIVLILLLTRFTFTLSPSYIHSPAIMLSLRPTNGLPLIVQHV
ncbi:hypothetical protein C5167_047788 [Papaver somniferum]|uniref:Cytochrome P450 n=1 Tax=Papaver somniferum TaxID=3469 RepID=A0A4Y7LKI6_PAPSO|nr:hypothetical protein C5167_047788 [Papaver somniferum]